MQELWSDKLTSGPLRGRGFSASLLQRIEDRISSEERSVRRQNLISWIIVGAIILALCLLLLVSLV